ncbi:hypothetical protein [Scytonema sp. NUACC21]
MNLVEKVSVNQITNSELGSLATLQDIPYSFEASNTVRKTLCHQP